MHRLTKLQEVLKAVEYLHSIGLIHRYVMAMRFNILAIACIALYCIAFSDNAHPIGLSVANM